MTDGSDENVYCMFQLAVLHSISSVVPTFTVEKAGSLLS